MEFTADAMLLQDQQQNLSSSSFWQEWDGVMRNGDHSVRNPIKGNLIIFVFDCICCVIGLPFSFYMAAMILCKKRLKRRAKNIFLLAIGFSDTFILSMTLIRIVYYLKPNGQLCSLYEAVGVLPYILFFFNLLLSLIDRYVAINHPIWHRNKVTVRFVILCQIVLNFVLSLAVKWVFLSHTIPFSCEIRFSHSVTCQLILVVELILCIAFHVAGYTKVKRMLQSSTRSISVKYAKKNTKSKSSNQQQNKNIKMIYDNKIITIHRSKAKLSNLEMKATRSFLVGVIPLLVLPCPILLYTLSFNLICIPLYGGDKCANYAWIFPYFRALIAFHVIIYVVITVVRNKDFVWPFSCTVWYTAAHTVDLEQMYG